MTCGCGLEGLRSETQWRCAVDTAAKKVEPSDPASLFTELDGEQRGAGGHMRWQVGPVGCCRTTLDLSHHHAGDHNSGDR